MSDQASGDGGYIVTPDGSTKKPSLFGKLKEKTKKAGSKIKHKVHKNPEDGTPEDHDGEEEEDTASDEAQSPISSPVTSTPRDFESEPSRFSGAKDPSETPDLSGLTINEPTSTPQVKSHEEPEHKSLYEPKSYGPAPPQESFQDSYQEPPQEPFEDSHQEPPQESNREPSFKSSQEPPQESSQEPPQESFQDSYQEPPQESNLESSFKSSQEPSEEPSGTEKASGATKGAKDLLYGGAAAGAGALGYDAYKNHDEEKPVTEKASDATSDFGSKAEEVGDRGYGAATGTKDSVAEQTKDTFGLPGSEPSSTDKAAETTDAAQSKAAETTDVAQSKAAETTDAAQSKAAETTDVAQSKAYEAKDALGSKTADLNNATDDSETYTQKATNAAQAAKESAAGALGVGTAAEGPSLVEKAKQTIGFDSVPADAPLNEQAESKASEATDTTQSKAYETKDAAVSKADEAKDTVGAKAADVNNATDDSQTYTEKAAVTAQTAKDSSTETLGLDKPSEGPSLVEKAKQSTGFDNTQGPSVVDTAKQNLASTVDTTKAYAANATTTAQDYTTQAKRTAVDTATPKQDDKALSEKITETLGALPTKAQETAANVTQSAKSTTDAHSGEPASPSILGKLGGLFGYGAKAPEHHDASTTPTTTSPTQ